MLRVNKIDCGVKQGQPSLDRHMQRREAAQCNGLQKRSPTVQPCCDHCHIVLEHASSKGPGAPSNIQTDPKFTCTHNVKRSIAKMANTCVECGATKMRGRRSTTGFQSQDVLECEHVVGHPVPTPLLHLPIKTLATIPHHPFLNPPWPLHHEWAGGVRGEG